MDDVLARLAQAFIEFDKRVREVGDSQWGMSTPDAEWDVRDLVNHIVSEDRWAVPLLAGQTIADVGDALDGDLLGSDPKSAWAKASEAALAAANVPGALSRTVQLSFGDFPGAYYLCQLVTDHTIHAWDLARAFGADDSFPPDLVEEVYRFLEPQAEGWRAAGAFGPKVEVDDTADRLTQLLALAGRARF